MAASDKPFRDQRKLDIVYAVSCILMLLSIGWMFAQDYYREYRAEQRIFREVEVAVAQRAALDLVPSKDEFDSAVKEVEVQREKRDKKNDELVAARAELARLQPKKENAEAAFQEVKADVESITSFLSIALEHNDTNASKKYEAQLKQLNEKLAGVQAKRDEITSQMKMEQVKIEAIEGNFNRAVAILKKVNDRFDTQVKVALNKRWGFGDWLRTQPIINGFADPLKIHQFTINDIPIDYNFRQVTRFDRCMSCHAGIDRPAFSRDNLESLTKDSKHAGRLEEARKLYDERMKALHGMKDAAMVPNPHSMTLVTLSDKVLTPARITEFCAHPNLDLYVGSNSKHPAEKFGCTSCHAGQGSGTSFRDSSHSPNNSKTRAEWSKERGWEPEHMWDFPMLPMRFIESSCLKCHHEVTDLISTDNRTEAPKLLRGYGLIKENGCFGCHEISGWKSGQRVGPDLRLEPTPPLDALHPIERNRAINDTDNRPGQMRKVGPALARVSEKVHGSWIEKWIKAPSSFRPDTKMPHYYGLSTNDSSVLPEDQKKFPDTEIASIAHFLTENSKEYLKKADALQRDDSKTRQADDALLIDLLSKGSLTSNEKKDLENVKWRIRLRTETKLVDLAPSHAGDAKKGRVLFTERGCLACHTHQGTETAQGTSLEKDKELFAPGVKSDAVFGPNLSQLPGKFGTSKEDKAAARKWLIQWIVDPHVYSPRSRMPVTHLTPNEAADIAAWLMNQEATDLGATWADLKVDQPTKADLKKLAEVYLVRMLSKSDMERFLKGLSAEDLEKYRKNQLNDESLSLLLKDVTDDERALFESNVDDEGSLKKYLGKKAVSRLGCYACHDIPGFDNAKPIGVGLNDWGKKPADRLAFEDIKNFYEKHYYSVDSLKDAKGNPPAVKDGKQPYEKFYADGLMGHNPTRESYLNQKIRDPRSYDYNRIRAWDDRSRMPKFTLARPRKNAGEEADRFEARVLKDEAEARESVATFVLGLVAEQVPLKSINTPTGDRLAEVKGRQILDKYNCSGCHLIRPGVYDFKASAKTIDYLENLAKDMERDMREGGEFSFKNHHNWMGRSPFGLDRPTAFGVKPTFEKVEGEDATVSYMKLNLSEALRFAGKDKVIRNLPAATSIRVPLEDFQKKADSIQSRADLDREFQALHPYGGTFTDLMVPWLSQRDPVTYPLASGDSGAARASLPPSLIGQGERTQADWLYSFLLNPQPVRKKSILRMPKFNMSKEEARMLVDYFAAITRLNNPGVGLQYPQDTDPARDELDSPYWRHKTAEYIAFLKATTAKDKENKVLKNKEGKEMTRYEERLATYTPIWEQIRKNGEPAIAKMDAEIKAKTQEKETALKEWESEKNAEAKGKLKTRVDVLTDEIGQLEKGKSQWDVQVQMDNWHAKEAYAADGYRLLSSRELCTNCHQVSSFLPSDPKNVGPALELAHMRLRPDWVERWVAKPQRFLPYSSLMPQYFSRDLQKYQLYHAGASQEQIRVLRDVLANYPRVLNLPVNRLHNPDLKK